MVIKPKCFDGINARKNVLVTGATGFVGRSLCGELTRRGFAVRAAVRRSCSCDASGVIDNCVAIGDIGPDTRWSGVLMGIDCVIHLAARVHVMVDQAADPLAEFRLVNRDGTLRLAEAAARCGVRRFIFISTIKVNGENTAGNPFTADDPLMPCEPYSVSKAEAEEGLRKLATKGGMDVVIIRAPLVYGPGVKANFYKLMRLIESGFPLPLGAIHNKRTLVALDNLVDLIQVCIDHPAAVNQVFLAGDGEDLSTTQIFKRLGAAMGKHIRLIPVNQKLLESILKIVGKADLARRICGSLQVDISKTESLLNWHPPLSVEEGFRKTAEWYLKSQRQ